MDLAGIDYQPSDNKITAADNLEPVKVLCGGFAHTEWPAFLNRLASTFNPLLPDILASGFPGLDQRFGHIRERGRPARTPRMIPQPLS